VTFQDRRVFSINGASGVVFAEVPTELVASGEIDSGVFDYGLTDEKISLYIDLSFLDNGGETDVAMSIDRAAFVHLVTLTDHVQPIGTGEARAHEFEIRLTLNRDAIDTDEGPIVRLWTLRAQPATLMTEEIVVPLLLGPRNIEDGGFSTSVDMLAQRDNIVDLCRTKNVALYQEGDEAWSVVVVDYRFDITHRYTAGDVQMGANGTCHTRMKVVT
jgi:hypothetical protein